MTTEPTGGTDRLRAEHNLKREFWMHMRLDEDGRWERIAHGPVPFGFREASQSMPSLFSIPITERPEDGDRFCIYEETYEWADGQLRKLT